MTDPTKITLDQKLKAFEIAVTALGKPALHNPRNKDDICNDFAVYFSNCRELAASILLAVNAVDTPPLDSLKPRLSFPHLR